MPVIILTERNLLSALESISKEVKDGKYVQSAGTRIMLVGSTMADGDDKIVDLLEKAGGNIVIEEFSEGIRPLLPEIKVSGNLIRNMADVYLEKRVPPALFHSVMKERFDYLLKLIKEFKVDAVVWYSLLYRDCYDREGLLFSRVLEKEAGIPFLKMPPGNIPLTKIRPLIIFFIRWKAMILLSL